jgi:signal transduction histidine kinase
MIDIGGLLDVGVLTIDANLVITGWNDWMTRATGRARADVVGRPLQDAGLRLRPQAIAAFERAVRGSVVIMSHALHEYLIEARPPQGFERYERMQQSVRILPLGGDALTPGGATAFVTDVTESVAREADLRAAVKEAQAANEAKSLFFNSMSHELRTPIGAVLGYADLLASDIFGPVTEVQREQIKRIGAISSHLKNIVEEILSFGSLEAGREQIHLSDAEAAELAEEALVAVEPLAAQKGLTLRRQYPSDRVALRTDQVKVRQILINLLGNAIKFTPRGSIELGVSTMERDGRPSVAFSVLDTGEGMAAGDLERIFEPFTRVQHRDQTSKGTGLGLAVSRGLARLLGGDITVTSEPGVGSRFTAIIPI